MGIEKDIEYHLRQLEALLRLKRGSRLEIEVGGESSMVWLQVYEADTPGATQESSGETLQDALENLAVWWSDSVQVGTLGGRQTGEEALRRAQESGQVLLASQVQRRRGPD